MFQWSLTKYINYHANRLAGIRRLSFCGNMGVFGQSCLGTLQKHVCWIEIINHYKSLKGLTCFFLENDAWSPSFWPSPTSIGAKSTQERFWGSDSAAGTSHHWKSIVESRSRDEHATGSAWGLTWLHVSSQLVSAGCYWNFLNVLVTIDVRSWNRIESMESQKHGRVKSPWLYIFDL